MTKQELFDKAYRGLASQGFEKSTYLKGNTERCAYRGSEGRRCAIGWCISDDDYTWDIEGKGCHTEAVAGLFPSMDPEWLSNLQLCHDISSGPQHMCSRLHDFAANHGLTVPDITQGGV